MGSGEGSRERRDDQLPQASLGKRRDTPFTYAPELLEAIPLSDSRTFDGQQAWVTLHGLRFTSLCPVTGQPDWAEITVNFIPAQKLIESKSLKEYLGSFRMHGDFHEDVCRIIADDISRSIAPRYLEVIGSFDSRGSIAIWPFVQYAADGDDEAAEIARHRRLNYAPGAWAPQRSVL
jgi:7-cyano-7-deazaguanine reductase